MQEDCSAAVALSDEETYARQARENFRALLNDMCFFEELSILGLGRFQFSRRRRMVAEFRSVYMAVWRLALGSSFPEEADAIFAAFCQEYLRRSRDRQAQDIVRKAEEYWHMLRDASAKDFRSLAEQLANLSARCDEEDRQAVTLKLALHIRTVYRLIFDRLI